MIETAYCGECGEEMTLVRPGKHQCDNPDCSEVKDAMRSIIYEHKIDALLGHSLLVSKLAKIVEDAYQEGYVQGIRDSRGTKP